jgi:pimeloyl-ACP methyl ester carboxylesterase
MRSIHSSRTLSRPARRGGTRLRLAAVLSLALPGIASAQTAPALDTGPATLTTFVRGTPIGSETVTITRTADGWTIADTGRMNQPLDIVARRIEARYTADWRARELSLDVTARGQAQTIRTVIDGGQAKSLITVNGQTTERADPVAPNAILMVPNAFFGLLEAVAARLRTAAAGTDIPVYGVPAVAFTLRIGETTPQQIQTPARMIAARRTRVTMALPAGSLESDLWTDEAGRMIRFSVPAQALEVVREDVASVSSRSVPISRPNDQNVSIPANGFQLAATLSGPAQASAARLPAVVLVGGSGPTDRDSLVAGIPLLGQVAGVLADAGFMVVRYDKRGVGQSGGRTESAGLPEYADDVRAVVKYMADRKDVDPKRIAVAGHSEGGTVALLAAANDRRIAAVGLLATPGSTGAELVLAQQQHSLARSSMTAEQKQAAIDLQRRIHDAVITGRGWEQLPISVRRAVDNPEFQTLLLNDPAKVVPNVRQPILIVQGALDTQVEPANADRLEALASARKNKPAVAVVRVPGVNHLLVPARTGEVDEYASLPDKQVSASVTQAIVEWLKKTL